MNSQTTSTASIISFWLLGALIVSLVVFIILFRKWDVPGWVKRTLHIQSTPVGIVVIVAGAIVLSVVMTLISALFQLSKNAMEVLIGVGLGFDFAMIPALVGKQSLQKNTKNEQNNPQRRQVSGQGGRRSRG